MYTTSSCPRTEFEYQVRSTRINCSETNLYMCVPNESLTSLYEFCYFEPVALSEGKKECKNELMERASMTLEKNFEQTCTNNI